MKIKITTTIRETKKIISLVLRYLAKYSSIIIINGKESGCIIKTENMAAIKVNLPYLLNRKHENKGIVRRRTSNNSEVDLNGFMMK